MDTSCIFTLKAGRPLFWGYDTTWRRESRVCCGREGSKLPCLWRPNIWLRSHNDIMTRALDRQAFHSVNGLPVCNDPQTLLDLPTRRTSSVEPTSSEHSGRMGRQLRWEPSRACLLPQEMASRNAHKALQGYGRRLMIRHCDTVLSKLYGQMTWCPVRTRWIPAPLSPLY